jgi:Ulp1 family protease
VEESHGKSESKGVFILPHEALEKTWNIYMNMPEFHRSFGKCTVELDSIRRFKPKSWLNDELVNCYAALLPKDRPFINVLYSYAFNKLRKSDEGYFRRIVRLVFFGPPSSLTIL